MVRRLITGSLMMAIGILLLSPISPAGSFRSAMNVAGILICVLSAAFLAGSFASPNSSVLRFDHFLPFLRKPRKNQSAAQLGWLTKAAQCLLPTRFFSDPQTAKPGMVRRFLIRMGPSVHSSPWRRAVQGVCFIAFLYLFFYVCWPYTAQPEPPGRVSRGWTLEKIDADTGDFVFAGGDDQWEPQDGSDLFVVAMDDTPAREYAVTFRPAAGGIGSRRLVPAGDISDEQFDAFLLGESRWDMYERLPDEWPSHYADDLAHKESVPAELFLVIDPLVSLSTAIAARSWVWSLASAAAILLVCILIPRGFCGYVCPLGTLIDLFDWAVAGRTKRFRVPDNGWWVHIKYYLLFAVLVAATLGVLISGYVAAIPVITRGLLFLGEPLQSGMLRGWHQVPDLNAGHAFSILLFAAVLGLGFLRPRFWCKYVCPSGAVFSLGNLFRVTERKVEQSCIHCNKCVQICPFDAIKPDFTTRVSDCTLCQSCGGVCPTKAIKFVERWNGVELKVLNDPPTGDTAIGRRGFLSLAAGTAAAVAGGAALAAASRSWGARLDDPAGILPVRPPGSVPEQEFLQLCIRCGECFKACPNNVLQPMAFEQGLEGLWTPQVVADWAGCESSCNACGQVCPTGAIRALPLEEKRVARMGLAIVNQQTCLPFANREACQLCVDECIAAGYDAIEFTRVHTQVDDEGLPVEGTGYVAPVVVPDRCVGCGLCQTRCYGINVKTKGLLGESAIIIEAGVGKEDRMASGSYRELREQEATRRDALPVDGQDSFFVPDLPVNEDSDAPRDAADSLDLIDPFGTGEGQP